MITEMIRNLERSKLAAKVRLGRNVASGKMELSEMIARLAALDLAIAALTLAANATEPWK